MQAAYRAKRAARPVKHRLEPALDQQRHWEGSHWGGGRFTLPKPKTRMVSRGPSEALSERAASSMPGDESAINSNEEPEIDLAGITREDENPDTPPSIKKRENPPPPTSRKRGRGRPRKKIPSPEPEPSSSSDSESSPDDVDPKKKQNQTPSRPPAEKVTTGRDGSVHGAAGNSSAAKKTPATSSATKKKKAPIRIADLQRKENTPASSSSNAKNQKRPPGPRFGAPKLFPGQVNELEPDEEFPENQRPPPLPRSPADRSTTLNKKRKEAEQYEEEDEEEGEDDPRPKKKSRRTPEPTKE